MMKNEIKLGQVYKHYKGNHYKILLLGKNSETGEEMVAYQRVEDNKIWFRPKDLFFNVVEWEGGKIIRFTLTEDI